MHQWKRRLRRIERLERKVHHDRRVFSDRIQHDWIVKLGGNFADDMDAFSFQLLQVR